MKAQFFGFFSNEIKVLGLVSKRISSTFPKLKKKLSIQFNKNILYKYYPNISESIKKIRFLKTVKYYSKIKISKNLWKFVLLSFQGIQSPSKGKLSSLFGKYYINRCLSSIFSGSFHILFFYKLSFSLRETKKGINIYYRTKFYKAFAAS